MDQSISTKSEHSSECALPPCSASEYPSSLASNVKSKKRKTSKSPQRKRQPESSKRSKRSRSSSRKHKQRSRSRSRSRKRRSRSRYSYFFSFFYFLLFFPSLNKCLEIQAQVFFVSVYINVYLNFLADLGFI